jgi:tetratricopeptide (TPR) repeat protein
MTRHAHRHCARFSTLLGSILCSMLASSAARADAHWADVESQIQYGYYSEDVRELENLANTLSSSRGTERGEASVRAAYFAAFAQYRLAEALRERDRHRAGVAASNCAHDLEAAPGADEDPDALALDAVCISLAHTLQTLRVPLLGPGAGGPMARAVQLAPRNPRVVLLDAVILYERSASRSERARALPRFEEAARLFEAERQQVSVTPGWGAAEAYGYLGRLYLDRGDPVAARGALERALLLAPDFLRARRLLREIVG